MGISIPDQILCIARCPICRSMQLDEDDMEMERNGTRLNGDQAAESPPGFDWRHDKTLFLSFSFSLSLFLSNTHHTATGQ